MADAKHTPGPWVVNPLLRSQICTAGPEPRALAITVGFGQSAEEQAATALLMAAAPELLAALQDVVRIARAASIGIPKNAPRIDRALAAIAKATGGTS